MERPCCWDLHEVGEDSYRETMLLGFIWGGEGLTWRDHAAGIYMGWGRTHMERPCCWDLYGVGEDSYGETMLLGFIWGVGGHIRWEQLIQW